MVQLRWREKIFALLNIHHWARWKEFFGRICYHGLKYHLLLLEVTAFSIEIAIHKSSISCAWLKKKNLTGDLSTVNVLNGTAPVSSHLMVVQKMKSFINQSKSLPISHKWVRSKQFRQEVTFCVMKMVLNIQYIADFPVKGCLFCGYTTGYVINSVGLREIFASSQLD